MRFNKSARLNNNLTENRLGTSISITSYTSSFYTIPYDGYISSYNSGSGSAGVELFGSNANSTSDAHINISATPSGREGFFVRKGMKVIVWGTQETWYFPLTH